MVPGATKPLASCSALAPSCELREPCHKPGKPCHKPGELHKLTESWAPSHAKEKRSSFLGTGSPPQNLFSAMPMPGATAKRLSENFQNRLPTNCLPETNARLTLVLLFTVSNSRIQRRQLMVDCLPARAEHDSGGLVALEATRATP